MFSMLKVLGRLDDNETDAERNERIRIRESPRPQTDANMAAGNCLYPAAIVITWLVLLGTITINMLAQFKVQEIGLFSYTTGDVPYGSDIAPIAETFAIWGVIYIYQLVWLAYATSTLCRRGAYGNGRLYHNPGFLPLALYPVYSFNLACNVTWIFLWDRLRGEIALPFLALIAFSLYVCIWLTMRGLNRHGMELHKAGKALEIRLVRGIVINGLGVYAAWTTIATLLNLAIVLEYFAGMARDMAGTVGLAILAAEILVYFILDNWVLEKHMRYLLTPYMVAAGALGGSLAKNYRKGSVNTIFTMVLLGIALGTLVSKVISMAVRHHRCKDPLLAETATLADSNSVVDRTVRPDMIEIGSFENGSKHP